jgi:hypothetical protein
MSGVKLLEYSRWMRVCPCKREICFLSTCEYICSREGEGSCVKESMSIMK